MAFWSHHDSEINNEHTLDNNLTWLLFQASYVLPYKLDNVQWPLTESKGDGVCVHSHAV